MPSAQTMLACYQAQLAASRGTGQGAFSKQAELGPTIRALIALVNADYDPRPHATHG